jgi:hypothetical protein
MCELPQLTSCHACVLSKELIDTREVMMRLPRATEKTLVKVARAFVKNHLSKISFFIIRCSENICKPSSFRFG